jgi:putative SOS response-associated peptidase YedK
MIDRYSIAASSSQLSEAFAVDVPLVYKPHYNAAPTQLLPVITSSSPQGVSFFYWGTSPEWSKNKTLSERVINTRAEGFNERPALKKALRKNRCIIPCDGFYAWKKVGKKTSIPYRFILQSKELFALAGLWEEFEDTDGNEIQTFTIITSPSNTLTATVYDRMPVMLSKPDEKIWLDAAVADEDLLALLVPFQDNTMTCYPVSPGISDIKLDVPSLIIPTPPADQFGNLTLFD